MPLKEKLEVFLKERYGTLFGIEYDLLLYDVTSTYFEDRQKRIRSQTRLPRDHRSDCKQVCIGLVVTRCGLPLGYEVFAGNRHDSKTPKEIITPGATLVPRRIWVMDRAWSRKTI